MTHTQLSKFRSLVEAKVEDESRLQAFLESHQSIVRGMVYTGHYRPMSIPQFGLGGKFFTDFAVVAHRSQVGWDVNFIEIEPAFLNRPLFDKKGHSANRLLGAERQIAEWQGWVRNYESAMVQLLREKLQEQRFWANRPEFYTSDAHPLVDYHIIIGRRDDFADHPLYRANYRERHNGRVNIHTWDYLLENFDHWIDRR